MHKCNVVNHDSLHIALRNWGRWVNLSMMDADVPSQHPEAPQWQQEYQAPNQSDPDKPEPVDETWAEEVQRAMVQLAADNVVMKTAKGIIPAYIVLTKFYRDGWDNQGRYINWARYQLSRYYLTT